MLHSAYQGCHPGAESVDDLLTTWHGLSSYCFEDVPPRGGACKPSAAWSRFQTTFHTARNHPTLNGQCGLIICVLLREYPPFYRLIRLWVHLNAFEMWRRHAGSRLCPPAQII